MESSVPELLRLAAEALERGDLRGAHGYLKRAAAAARAEARNPSRYQSTRRRRGGSRGSGRIDDLFKRLDETAEDQLAEAEQRLSRDDGTIEALKDLKRISLDMSGREPGSKAKFVLEEAMKDPKVRLAMEEADAQGAYQSVASLIDDQWEQALRRAAKVKVAPRAGADFAAAPPPKRPGDVTLVSRMPVNRQAEILDKLRLIAKNCGRSPTGKKAAGLLKTLEADKKIIAAVKKHAADRVILQEYRRAEMYDKAGLRKKAAEYYRRFLEKYPDSDCAARVRERLKALG